MNKRALGGIYESLAIEYLSNSAYKLIETNYYSPYGEVDLIMKRDEVLHFIEVKFRSNNFYGSPRSSISATKKKRLKLTAVHYLKAQDCGWSPFKIGFIGITIENKNLVFDYIENIFE